jgi:hypothetical protein
MSTPIHQKQAAFRGCLRNSSPDQQSSIFHGRLETVRWRLFQTAGKIIRHGRQVFLKISGEALDIFVMIRERCARILAEGGAVPETS